MKNRINFAGMNGFVWWVGIIENRVDPLGMGRCQVRIFGWHTENLALLPTQNLPWSIPMFPVNNSKSWIPPNVNEWVVGFFMDGDAGQFPVMMGVLPGLQQDRPGLDPQSNPQ